MTMSRCYIDSVKPSSNIHICKGNISSRRLADATSQVPQQGRATKITLGSVMSEQVKTDMPVRAGIILSIQSVAFTPDVRKGEGTRNPQI
jgi:hypothetical protein